MRTTQRVASLTTSFVLLCGLALLVTGCSARRSEQRRVEGDAYYRLARYDQAADSYQKSLEADPANVQAKLGLAKCAAVRGNDEKALQQFLELVEVEPTLVAPYVEAVDILYGQERFEEAISLARNLENVDAERGGALRALIAFRQGDLDDALSQLAALRDKLPRSAHVRVNLASALLAAGRPEEAEKEAAYVLDEIDAQSPAARVALIEAYKALGKTEEMVESHEKFLQEDPDNIGLKIGLATSLAYAGRLDEAESMVRGVLDEVPDSGWANYVLGACLVERGEFSAAVPRLQLAAKVLPGQVAVAKKLAVALNRGKAPTLVPSALASARAVAAENKLDDWKALWRQGAIATLIEHRDTLAEDGGEELTEVLVLAALLVHDVDKAEVLVATLPDSSPMGQFYFILKKAVADRNPKDVVDFYKSWEESDELGNGLRDNAYGYALALGGARAEAIRFLSESLTKSPANGVTLYNIAQVFRQARMPQFAAKTIEQITVLYPGNLDAHLALYSIFREGGLKAEARRAAEATFVIFPAESDAIINLAQSYLDLDLTDRALKVLQRGLELVPGDGGIHLAMAGIELQEGNPEQAQRHMDQVSERRLEEASAQMLTAFIAAEGGDWPGVLQVWNETSERYPTSPIGLMGAAALLFQSTDPAGAEMTKALGEQTRRRRPTSVLVHALGRRGADLKPSEKILAEALAADPPALAEFARGVAFNEGNLYDAAYRSFAKVAASIPDKESILQFTLGAVARSHFIDDRAVVARALVAKAPELPGPWVGLAGVMRSLNDTVQEEEALDKALELEPGDVTALQEIAALYDRQEEIEKAIAIYGRLIEISPDDAISHNNLAYHLLTVNRDLEQALSSAHKAQTKMSKDGQILHTLGLAQLRKGELKESYSSLNRALQLRPGDPTLLLDYGQLLLALERDVEGKRHIQLALRYADQFGLDFPRREEAERLVQAP